MVEATKLGESVESKKERLERLKETLKGVEIEIGELKKLCKSSNIKDDKDGNRVDFDLANIYADGRMKSLIKDDPDKINPSNSDLNNFEKNINTLLNDYSKYEELLKKKIRNSTPRKVSRSNPVKKVVGGVSYRRGYEKYAERTKLQLIELLKKAKGYIGSGGSPRTRILRGDMVAITQVLYNKLVESKKISGKKLVVDGIYGRHTGDAIKKIRGLVGTTYSPREKLKNRNIEKSLDGQTINLLAGELGASGLGYRRITTPNSKVVKKVGGTKESSTNKSAVEGENGKKVKEVATPKTETPAEEETPKTETTPPMTTRVNLGASPKKAEEKTEVKKAAEKKDGESEIDSSKEDSTANDL